MRRSSYPATACALLALAAAVLAGRPAWADVPWSRDTGSPRTGAVGPDADLHRVCGAPDRALAQVAAALIARRLAGRAPEDTVIKQLARRAGVPHPWPRAWLLGGAHPRAEIASRLARWIGGWSRDGNLRRCGVAHGASARGEPFVAVIAVEALADLAPIARRARASQWLALDAALHVSAERASVVLLGPRGRPRRVLSSMSNGRVRSRFSLDRPGRWLVQLVADVEGGPRPLLEAEVFVESEPPAKLDDREGAAKGNAASAGALLALLNTARGRERLAPLRHDAALEAVAADHVRAMMRAGRVAHDVGDGTPEERVETAGIAAGRVGENVARAPSVPRLHRALWDSPSHRENMLDPELSRVGVALGRDARGRLWAVQLFAE